MNKFVLLIIMSGILSGCGKKLYPTLTAEVNVVSQEAHKMIELRSIGYGDTKETALLDSETKVFEILFFRGIPNSNVENPIIGSNEKEILALNSEYFEDFFKGRYRSFVMSSYQASPPQRKKGIITQVTDLKINLLSLKKDLEANNVIRKFGL